jgi:hypothetical protein
MAVKWFNTLISDMLCIKLESWIKAKRARKGSAPVMYRPQLLSNACKSILKSAIRIESKPFLEDLEHVGAFFRGHVLEVIHSEPFRCLTNQTAETGYFSKALLQVLCESCVPLEQESLFAKAQLLLCGNAQQVRSIQVFTPGYFFNCVGLTQRN